MTAHLRPSMLVLVGTVSLFLGGCIVPYHYVGAPAVAGQVVSRSTGQPVVGASVSMTVTDFGYDSVRTHTDAAGSFRLPAVQHWMLLPIPTDGFRPPEGTLRVEAPHYRPYTDGVSTESVPPRDDFQRLHIALTPGA